MATGFIRRIIALLACGACGVALAADVALIGVMGNRTAVLAVDGGEPKALRVGQKWNGISVLEVQKDRATVEVEGVRRVLLLGQHYRSTTPSTDREQVILSADTRGHFIADGAVNGNPVRFLVDTGATLIALPGSEAVRLGLDYRKGERGNLQTAGGVVQAYRVTLDRVKIGAIELSRVDAVVVERGLETTLLGMSFLNRVEMRRDGPLMTLIRRF